jgi:hypothetical protein
LRISARTIAAHKESSENPVWRHSLNADYVLDADYLLPANEEHGRELDLWIVSK